MANTYARTMAKMTRTGWIFRIALTSIALIAMVVLVRMFGDGPVFDSDAGAAASPSASVAATP